MYEALRQVSSPIYLEAAYGRSFTTKEAALCAWNSGKDLKIVGGPYCSIRNFQALKDEHPSGIYIEYGTNHSIRIF